ncbi:NUDIX domain-containing protein [Sphingomonas bacterium]|uniref:NUDIX domain-containing protein n=1 Tax=Sphingomonas bacterium TaxID=1895847 RepID=UPI001577209D|nr:NUDIX domain-containing protein [Sphingomonas bacterium]
MSKAPGAIPAATVVIFRDAADGGAPELLMVERAAAMAFAAGAVVFPGGRVDDADRALAVRLGGDVDETAARIAAIRETIEEVGLAIAIEPEPSAATLATMRAALHAGAPLGTVLNETGLRLKLDALVPFARWRPEHRTTRIYDTRFYLARLPAGAPAATVDQTENVRLFWATAAQVLAECAAGRASAIFPTLRNLERLARFATVDEAEADALAHPIEVVTPWSQMREGVEHLCIPEGLGYPVTAAPLAGIRRG